MANNCSVCGVNMDMVGRSHRCIPVAVKATDPAVRTHSDLTRSGTYQHRDPDKRRAYMRDYMRKKRNGNRQASENQSQA